MNKVECILALLLSLCHGHQVQVERAGGGSHAYELRYDPLAESRASGSTRPVGASTDLSRLAMLLMAFNTPAGHSRNLVHSASKDKVTATSAQDFGRRTLLSHGLAVGGAALLSEAPVPAYAKKRATGSDGKWANKQSDFSQMEFNFIDGFKETSSGLRYKTVEAFTEEKPRKGQKVQIQYVAYTLDGTRFQNTWIEKKGEPLVVQVGKGEVIKGLDETLADMSVFEKRIVRVPPELGYGDEGIDLGYMRILPKKFLVYYVEMVNFL